MPRTEKRDRWDKAQIVGQYVVAIVIAIVGAYISFRISEAEQETTQNIADATAKLTRELDAGNKAYLTEQEKQYEDFIAKQSNLEQESAASQAESDRVALLLPLLASSNELEQKMAIKVLLDLKERGMFPEELGETLMEFFPDPRPEEVYLADNTSNIKTSTAPPSKPRNAFMGLEDEVAALFPRIYFYVLSEEQKRSLMPAREALATDENAYKRRKVFVMSEYNVAQSELRYFFPSDQKEAEHIQTVLKNSGIQTKTVESKSRPNTLNPRHFEVWLK